MHMATRISKTLLFFLPLALAVPSPSQAHTEDGTIGFFLTDARGTCADLRAPSCNDESIQLAGELNTPYYAVVCVFNADDEEGVAGMSFGIDYNNATGSGVDVDSWTRCADLGFPTDNWPEAGTGSRITWDPEGSCQREVPGDPDFGLTAMGGFFYVIAYSQDRLEIIENIDLLSGPELKIATCEAREIDIDPVAQAGALGFSSDQSEEGVLPCLPHPKEETTWGTIKTLYGNN